MPANAQTNTAHSFYNAEDILSTNAVWQYGNISCDPVEAVRLCVVHTVVSPLYTLYLLRLMSNPG